jgi:hypothetical protein
LCYVVWGKILIQSLVIGSRIPYKSITLLSLGLMVYSLVWVPSLHEVQYILWFDLIIIKKGALDSQPQVIKLLAHGRWFSPGTPASSTTKAGRHDIAEILLKVALSPIIHLISQVPLLILRTKLIQCRGVPNTYALKEWEMCLLRAWIYNYPCNQY